MAEKEYIIGDSPVPSWCARYITPFIRADGKTGWEFWGVRKAYFLSRGDMLVLAKGKIKVRRGNETTKKMD